MTEGLRLSETGDRPALEEIWETAFGGEDIDAFFQTYFRPDMAVIAEYEGKPAASAYVLPTGRLMLPGGNGFPCAMVYAVATLPEYRGRGLGEAVTRAAAERGIKAGYPIITLCPASDSLFAFYGSKTDFRDWFYICETRLTAEDLPDVHAEAREVSADEYRELRKIFLKDRAHIDMDERGLAYQKRMCSESGGGMFAVLSGGSVIGCTTVEMRAEGNAVFKELLAKEESPVGVAAAAAAVIRAERYEVRTPSCFHGGIKRRFAMMLPSAMVPETPEKDAWYGFAFD